MPPAYQSWASDPESPIEVTIEAGVSPVPDPIAVTFNIRGAYQGSGVHGRLLPKIMNEGSWLTGSTEELPWNYNVPAIDSQPWGDYIVVPESGGQKTSTLSFHNTDSLSPGTYEAQVKLVLFHFMSSMYFLYSVFTTIVRLNVVGDETLGKNKDYIEFFHVQGNTPLPAATFKIWGASWVVDAPPKYILSSAAPGVIITEETDPETEETFYRATGGGLVEFTISPSGYFDTEEALSLEWSMGNIRIYTPDELTELFIAVRTLLSSSSDFFDVSPDELFFDLAVGADTDSTQTIVVNSTSEIEVSGPAWLSITVVQSSESPTSFSVLVAPIPADNFSSGNYEGAITITPTDFPEQAAEVPVTMRLTDFAVMPYTSSALNFTKEALPIIFSSPTPGAYFLVTLHCTVFDFFTGVSKQFTLDYKVWLFQNRGELYLGPVVHRLMSEIEAYRLEELQYKLAQVRIDVKEVSGSGESQGTVLRSNTFSNLRFVAGFRRPNIQDDFGILHAHSHPQRVTRAGFALLNMLLPAGAYTLRILKQNDEIASSSVFSGEYNILSRKIDFSELPIDKGDFIRCEVFRQGFPDVVRTKSFICFPDALMSTMIVWTGTDNLLHAFEFTGDYRMPVEFESTSRNGYKALQEYLERTETRRVRKINISTGWILKTDEATIDDLLESPLCWIIVGSKKFEVVPLTKSFTASDSTSDTIAFDVEFQINHKNDAQDYTF